MPSHSIAKSALKPIFSPLPHPTFFAPKSPFFPLFPVSNPISGDFSRARTRFLPCKAHFFLVFPRPDPKFWGFFEEYFAILPPPTAFSIHAPSPFTFLPTFFLFPPHFFNTFPNKRTNARTLAHYARTRTPAHTYTSGGFRLLPSPLHTPSQSTGHQCVRGEEKREKAFTEHTTISESISYHKRPISSTVNSICRRDEPRHHHREPKNQKPSPITRCATTICGIRVKR